MLFVNHGRQGLSARTINEIFVEGVTRFQMQVTGPASFRTDLRRTAAGRDARRGRRRREARLRSSRAKAGNVTFEVPVVEDIPVNERTRKFQLIVAAPA